jgi:hypothetical protein
MSRKNKNKQPAAVWLYRHTIKSPAWQALSVGARATYIELAANYNTNMKNAVYLSIRTGAQKLGVDKKVVIRWLHELAHYGFVHVVQKGTIGVYGYGRATQYRLTDRPFAGAAPTHDFQNWTGEIYEPKKQKPGPPKGPHRSPRGTIGKSGQASSLWSPGRTIRNAPNRSPRGTITSVASHLALTADAAGLCADAADASASSAANLDQLGALKVWAMPVQTEIHCAADRQRLYCQEIPDGFGHNAGPLLQPEDDLSIPTFLRRG